MAEAPLRVLLVGHGRMGRMIEGLAPDYGIHVVGSVTSSSSSASSWPAADVAIDFSKAEAVGTNLRRAAALGMCAVIGTTGWHDDEAALRSDSGVASIGVIAAPNFAVGVFLFHAVAERAAQLAVSRGFAPWIHEAHHSAKRDAPSGTALSLRRVVESAGQAVDVSSTRAGHIPGTHTVGFDSPSEFITLTHTARDRTPFARGALQAAHWIRGRRGWFSMQDMLQI